MLLLIRALAPSKKPLSPDLCRAARRLCFHNYASVLASVDDDDKIHCVEWSRLASEPAPEPAGSVRRYHCTADH